MNARERQQAKGKRFVELHARPGAFLIPNPWDAGTARILEHMGFKALTTTSAGLAYTLGKAHGSGQVTREETLTNAMAIVDATDLPVAADLENGYGDSPEVVAETIRIAGEEAGLVGGSIDDATGDPRRPTYEFAHTVESVAAAVEAARGFCFRSWWSGGRRTLCAGGRIWPTRSGVWRRSRAWGRMRFTRRA